MTIETKYNVGDSMWLINGNEIKKTIITTLGINPFEGNINYPIESYIRYNLKSNLGNLRGSFLDKELFKTKEELIASL